MTLLLCGASTRAAAFSAIAAGYAPFCIDLFADADLKAACPVVRLPSEDYPDGFIELARRAPPGPWAYVGGLENYPKVVEAISRERPLWGNGAEVLQRVRNPQLLHDTVVGAGLLSPRVSVDPRIVPVDGSWLVKPLRGSGGRGIRRWRGVADGAEGDYFQEWIAGEPVSFSFLAGSDGQAEVLGSTQQLVGLPWLHSRPFAYCGSLTPLVFGDQAPFARIATVLTEAFGLRGLCGVDCVWHEDGLWIIEVNPRYAASVEVVEAVTGVRAFAGHAAAFSEGDDALANGIPEAPAAGKCVYYAPWDLTVSRDLGRLVAPKTRNADVPAASTPIRRGAPVLTVLASGDTLEECLALLQSRASALDKAFQGCKCSGTDD